MSGALSSPPLITPLDDDSTRAYTGEMRPLLALVLAFALPASGLAEDKPKNPKPRVPDANPSPQQGFEIDVAPFELQGGNAACVRMRLTGSAFQPWTCENVPASVSATWLIAPTGEKRLAVTVRAAGEPWVLEHLVELGADGVAPKDYSAQLYRYNPDRCPVSDPASMTFIELSLHNCQVQRQKVAGGVLYHGKRGLIVDGRIRANFSFVGTGSSFWGQNGTTVELDAASARTFKLDHPAAPGSLREASYSDRDRARKPFQDYVVPPLEL